MTGFEKEELIKANDQFYRAFEKLDVKELGKVWAHEDYVQCIHPGWSPCSGWQKVRDSRVLIFNHTASIRFTITDIKAHIKGSFGWVVCFENLESLEGESERWVKSQVLATNIYEMKEGKRKIRRYRVKEYWGSETICENVKFFRFVL